MNDTEHERWLDLPATEGFDPGMAVRDALGIDALLVPIDEHALPADVREWLGTTVAEGLAGMSVREAIALVAGDDRTARLCRAAREVGRA